MFDLTGRKALVTGATGGLGGAIARALHEQGAIVSISGTRAEALDALASELGEGRVHPLVTNLSDKDAVEALVPAAEAAMGGLDILVNNAGITRVERPTEAARSIADPPTPSTPVEASPAETGPIRPARSGAAGAAPG